MFLWHVSKIIGEMRENSSPLTTETLQKYNTISIPAGKAHYRLLCYLSEVITRGNIINIGTGDGINLSYLASFTIQKIHTFDISCRITDTVLRKNIHNNRNVVLHYADFLTDREKLEHYRELVLSSSLVFLDLLDPQLLEKLPEIVEFVRFLQENRYLGLVVVNGIWENKEIRDGFWLSAVEDRFKLDLTEFGHVKGTGAITFSDRSEIDYPFLPFSQKKHRDSWTLVTAYFNLTKCSDASAEIKARDAAYYFHHAVFTLSLPYNLVIYCDRESLSEIQKYRPAYLASKTRYIITEFDDFLVGERSFREYREKINQNRQEKPYNFDPRNTASYYLFCVSRYIMLQNTIVQNFFGSTHFCWINFCMERMGYLNCVHLDEALAVKRDKFSTCYIDFIPESLVKDTAEYFRWGRCGMCSGFFTGNGQYMFQTCGAILAKFVEYVDAGYGHADEQLYSPVFFEHPDWFEQYFGDYQEMITNYRYIYDAPEKPLRNFIRNSFSSGFYAKCFEACSILWESFRLGKCTLEEGQLRDLCYYKMMSELRSK